MGCEGAVPDGVRGEQYLMGCKGAAPDGMRGGTN